MASMMSTHPAPSTHVVPASHESSSHAVPGGGFDGGCDGSSSDGGGDDGGSVGAGSSSPASPPRPVRGRVLPSRRESRLLSPSSPPMRPQATETRSAAVARAVATVLV